MILNGDLDVLGSTKIKIIEDDSYVFDAADVGLLVIQSGVLYFNDGSSLREFTLEDFKATLSNSLGFVLSDLSIDPATLNALDNVSGLDGNSSLLSALSQLDARIPTKFTTTLSASTTHTISHNLGSENLHITVYNDTNNTIINDATVQIVTINQVQITLSISTPIRVLITQY